MSEQVFGPPNAVALWPLRYGATRTIHSSFLLRSVNESKSDESAAREQASGGASFVPRNAFSPKSKLEPFLRSGAAPGCRDHTDRRRPRENKL